MPRYVHDPPARIAARAQADEVGRRRIGHPRRRERGSLGVLLVALVIAMCCLLAARASADTGWLAPAALTGSRVGNGDQSVASDRRGDVLVALSRVVNAHHEVAAMFRRAGGRFGAPVVLSSPHASADTPVVAFDRRGNAIVAWHEFAHNHEDAIFAAFRTAGGRFAPAVKLSPPDAQARQPQLAFDQDGDATVVWAVNNTTVNNMNDLSAAPAWRCCATGRREVVQAAVRPAGGTFRAAVNVSAESRNGNQVQSPQVAIDARGETIVVWTRCDTTGDACRHEPVVGSYVVQAAIARSGTRFAAPIDLSAPGEDSTNPRIAVDRAGDAVVVWLRSPRDYTHGTIQEAARIAGRGFGPPIDLAADGQDPIITSDAAGQMLIAWNQWRATASASSRPQPSVPPASRNPRSTCPRPTRTST